jgi:cytidylate kinase
MYPEVDYHLFITASLNERVRRKLIQYNGEESEESIRENLMERDKYHEEAGFHKLYDKTIVIDVTDCKSARESTELVLKTIHYGDYK